MDKNDIVKATKNWVENVVIDLNLCPFAKKEFLRNSIRFEVSEAKTEQELLFKLIKELELISENKEIETTLLIHPYILEKFEDYIQFLALADDLLVQMEYEGVFQIASFHPQYQFAETNIDSAENYTNRSPFPMVHILREESLERAIENYPNTQLIPEENIKKMNEMGVDKMRLLLQNCTSFMNQSK